MFKNGIKLAVLMSLVAALVTSCVASSADGPPIVYAERNLLFYMAGDGNGLSDEIAVKTDILLKAWNHPVGHLFIYQDRGEEFEPCLLEVVREEGGNRLDTLETYGQENSASIVVFRRVIDKVTTIYPTHDFGLVMTAESNGWMPENSFMHPRTVGSDRKDVLELKDFAAAIPTGACRFIAFESSLMAGLEVAYELKDKTDYILASPAEILSPGFAGVYAAMLQSMMSNPFDLSGAAQSYFNYRNLMPGADRAATISIINTSELVPLKKILNVAEKRVKQWEYVDRNQVQHFDRNVGYHLFYDASAYIRLIGTPEESAAFDAALGRAVIFKAATPEFLPDNGGFAIRQNSGMTIYIPSGRFPWLNEKRKELKLHQ